MDFSEHISASSDPERPACRWVSILRHGHPPLEVMARALEERLRGVDYVLEVTVDGELSDYALGPGQPNPALRGAAVLVPLADFPADDPDFARLNAALAPEWAVAGMIDGPLAPHPTRRAEAGIDDLHRRQAESIVRQIVGDSRFDHLTDEQRDIAIALNTVWANITWQLRKGRADALTADPDLMAAWTVVHNEITRELATRGNLPSWMWDDRFWDAAGMS